MSKAVTTPDFDAVVIGGGHNALIAAALLQRRGARVALFEARAQLGGFAGTHALGAGVEAPLAVDDWGLLREDLLGELELGQHGLGWVEADRLATLRSLPERGGSRGDTGNAGDAVDGADGDLVLWRDPERCAAAWERDAAGDGARLRRFLGELDSVLSELEELWRTPPALRELGRLVLSPALMRWCAGSLEELLGASFDGACARTALAALALRGSAWGPSAAGTGILLLHQLAGTGPRGFRAARRPAGGAGALVSALERAAAGVQISRATPVRQILVDHGARNGSGSPRAAGVRLADGSEVTARLVLSGLDRRTTLLHLVGSPRLPVQSVRRLLVLRHRGVRSRAFVPAQGGALQRLAPAGAPLLVVRDLEQLERAADDAKWGRPAARPWLELSAWPRSSGGATWTVNAQCAPQTGSRDASESWGAAVRAELTRVAGGVLGVEGWSQLLPADWERELGATGGCEHHGDMLLDQLFLLRGTERAAGARTEIEGLLLCGSGAHPGGGVTGLPGWHAAELAAREL